MISSRFSHIQGLVVFLFALSFWWTLGCSSTQEKPTGSANELLMEGRLKLKLNQLNDGKTIFEQILQDYPDSRERVMALLHLAEVSYKLQEYEEARFHFQKFTELYPVHPQVDRAHYYVAMSDFRMMDIAGRDQSHTKAALEEFERLIDNYPKSPYRARAIKKKNECARLLAQSEFEIGKFYFRTRSYQSAILRLKNVIKDHPDQSFNEEAMFLLAESYYEEQNFSEAKTSYRQFLKKYPRSEFAREARTRLKAIR